MELVSMLLRKCHKAEGTVRVSTKHMHLLHDAAACSPVESEHCVEAAATAEGAPLQPSTDAADLLHAGSSYAACTQQIFYMFHSTSVKREADLGLEGVPARYWVVGDRGQARHDAGPKSNFAEKVQEPIGNSLRAVSHKESGSVSAKRHHPWHPSQE